MDFSLTEEQRLYQRAVRDFAANELAPYAAEVDEQKELHWPSIEKMPRLGLTGLQVPEQYGGAALDSIAAALALEEIARACGSTGLAVAAHNGLCCTPIVRWGTDAQKEAYLPTLTGSGKLGALALTEPDAGSDLAGGVRTTAVRDGDCWVVSGSKMWITNAPSAPVIVTLVRTAPQAEKPSHGLSLLLVERDTPGFEVGPPIEKMGVRGSHSCPLTFDEARVPLDNLLGEEGRGLHQTLEVLDGGRVGIAAVSVGLAQAALDEALRYTQERRTFGQALIDHQGVRFKLADMATRLEAARRLTYYAAWLKDQGQRYTQAAAMAKLFASDAAEFISREAVQLHGGYGYSTEFPVERIYRDQRLMSIGEGANEVLKMVIAGHLT